MTLPSLKRVHLPTSDPPGRLKNRETAQWIDEVQSPLRVHCSSKYSSAYAFGYAKLHEQLATACLIRQRTAFRSRVSLAILCSALRFTTVRLGWEPVATRNSQSLQSLNRRWDTRLPCENPYGWTHTRRVNGRPISCRAGPPGR